MRMGAPLDFRIYACSWLPCTRPQIGCLGSIPGLRQIAWSMIYWNLTRCALQAFDYFPHMKPYSDMASRGDCQIRSWGAEYMAFLGQRTTVCLQPPGHSKTFSFVSLVRPAVQSTNVYIAKATCLLFTMRGAFISLWLYIYLSFLHSEYPLWNFFFGSCTYTRSIIIALAIPSKAQTRYFPNLLS